MVPTRFRWEVGGSEAGDGLSVRGGSAGGL